MIVNVFQKVIKLILNHINKNNLVIFVVTIVPLYLSPYTTYLTYSRIFQFSMAYFPTLLNIFTIKF